MRNIIKWLTLSLVILLMLSTAAFVIWGLNPAPLMDEAEAAMASTDTGLIFYPGGHVDPRACAPAAHKNAENGYFVVIVPMPLNHASLAGMALSLGIMKPRSPARSNKSKLFKPPWNL